MLFTLVLLGNIAAERGENLRGVCRVHRKVPQFAGCIIVRPSATEKCEKSHLGVDLMSALVGTEPTKNCVRYGVANGGKAENICSI